MSSGEDKGKMADWGLMGTGADGDEKYPNVCGSARVCHWVNFSSLPRRSAHDCCAPTFHTHCRFPINRRIGRLPWKVCVILEHAHSHAQPTAADRLVGWPIGCAVACADRHLALRLDLAHVIAGELPDELTVG